MFTTLIIRKPLHVSRTQLKSKTLERILRQWKSLFTVKVPGSGMASVWLIGIPKTLRSLRRNKEMDDVYDSVHVVVDYRLNANMIDRLCI